VITISDMVKMSAVTYSTYTGQGMLNHCTKLCLIIYTTRFHLQKFCVFFTLHISSVLSVILRINSEYFRIQHLLIGYCNRDCVCSLCVLIVCAHCVCSLCALIVCAHCVRSLCVLIVCTHCVCSLCVLIARDELNL